MQWIGAALVGMSTYEILAQDALLSQPYESGVLLNPARAGMIAHNYQLIGLYRSQWNQLTDPFNTVFGSLNTNVPTGRNKNHVAGFAFSGYADKTGSIEYATATYAVTGAYHRNWGTDWNRYMGMGVTLGLGSTTFDMTKLRTDEHYLIGSTSDLIGFHQSAFTDVSWGFEYNLLSDSTHLNLGFAIHHINRPVLSYTQAGQSRIPARWVASASYSYPFWLQTTLAPRGVFMVQGMDWTILLGADLNYMLQHSSLTGYGLTAGLYLRMNQALITRLVMDIGDLSVGLSYDIGLGPVARSGPTGTPEVVLVYNGKIKGISSGRIYNPRF